MILPLSLTSIIECFDIYISHRSWSNITMRRFCQIKYEQVLWMEKDMIEIGDL